MSHLPGNISDGLFLLTYDHLLIMVRISLDKAHVIFFLKSCVFPVDMRSKDHAVCIICAHVLEDISVGAADIHYHVL